MKYQIFKAVVVGSGTMGAALAAHLANAGVAVTLLDIIPDKLIPDEEKAGGFFRPYDAPAENPRKNLEQNDCKQDDQYESADAFLNGAENLKHPYAGPFFWRFPIERVRLMNLILLCICVISLGRSSPKNAVAGFSL